MELSLKTVIFNCPKSADWLWLSATSISQKSDKSHVLYSRLKGDSILIYYDFTVAAKNICNYSILLEMFQKFCFKGDSYDIPLFPLALSMLLKQFPLPVIRIQLLKMPVKLNLPCKLNSSLSSLLHTVVLNELARSLMVRSFESLSSRRPAAPGCG